MRNQVILEGRVGRLWTGVDCAVWAKRLRRAVGTWAVGDRVAVEGVRRRFYRTPAGTAASLVEVEATGGRVIRRAGRA